MGMLFACVHFQLLRHLPAKAVVRQHSFDGMFQHHLWLRLHHVLDRFEASSTRIEGVVVVFLQLLSLAGNNNLFGIDDDNEIAKVCVGCEGRFVFTPDDMGNLRGNSSDGLTGCIDQEPLLLDMLGREELCFWCGIHSTSKS